MENSKRIEDVDFMTIGSKEARELGPFGEDDGPVAVTCYGDRETWKSRKAALEFYKTAAMCCDGSEAGRYWSVVSGLESGADEADDGGLKARQPDSGRQNEGMKPEDISGDDFLAYERLRLSGLTNMLDWRAASDYLGWDYTEDRGKYAAIIDNYSELARKWKDGAE